MRSFRITTKYIISFCTLSTLNISVHVLSLCLIILLFNGCVIFLWKKWIWDQCRSVNVVVDTQPTPPPPNGNRLHSCMVVCFHAELMKCKVEMATEKFKFLEQYWFPTSIWNLIVLYFVSLWMGIILYDVRTFYLHILCNSSALYFIKAYSLLLAGLTEE